MSSPKFGNSQELPVQFVNSMRTLFGILDEYNRGVIHISDIEAHWQGLDSHDMPRGLLPSFRSVALAHNGILTFDRFMTAIKLALANDSVSSGNNINERNVESRYTVNDDVLSKRSRDQVLRQSHSSSNVITAPSTNFSGNGLQHRTFSMSHLPDSNNYVDRPPLTSDAYKSSPPNQPGKWWSQDARASVASMSALDKYPKDRDGQADHGDGTVPLKTFRQNHTRRHTVTSGVDYHMIKRMKQLEQHKDMILQGLEAVNQVRDWYSEELSQIQDRQRRLTGDRQDQSIDYDQEKSDLMMVRVKEMNQHLNSLVQTTHRTIPSHMNLVTSTSARNRAGRSRSPEKSRLTVAESLEENDDLIMRLRSQVKQLSQDLGHKSERIGQLEHEKAQLIKEMFQASSKHRNGTFEDASYI